MNRKQKSMINSYENVNEIMQKYTDLQIDKDTCVLIWRIYLQQREYLCL